MRHNNKDRNLIIEEWKKFINKGKKPRRVDDCVFESWARCRELDIDPYSGRSEVVFSQDKFNQILAENRWLINVVKPFIDRIYKNINTKNYIVFLTDSKGRLIYLKGEEGLKESFNNKFNFQVGASWSEMAVGTTAVSMVIKKRVPVSFMAEEKYCFELKRKACSAVPIKNSEGEFSGVLGVAADFATPNDQIFGLLMAMEMAIENKLKLENITKELNVVNSCYRGVFNNLSDAVILLDNDGIIKDINKKGSRLLSLKREQIIGCEASEVLDFNPVNVRYISDGQNRKFEIKNYDLDSSYFLTRVVPVKSNDNQKDSLKVYQKESGNSSFSNNTKYTFSDIIGESKAIKKVKREARRAAQKDYNILLSGRSGTGKELFAQAIHNASLRGEGPFIALNCGAVPEKLMESEFFGYEEGSFTGAKNNGQKGKLELARGGTLFLDEIAEMPKQLQVKLLRVLEEREFRRLGGDKLIPVDIRVIAATNKNLSKEVEKGNFREDLYWRLNVINIKIPLLKDRKEDIVPLFHHFMQKYADQNRDETNCKEEIFTILKGHNWPGNVRELENVVKRILSFREGNTFSITDIPEYIRDNQINCERKSRKNMSLDEAEKEYILKKLKENDGNLAKTARQLNISRTTIYNKLEKYNINRTNFVY